MKRIVLVAVIAACSSRALPPSNTGTAAASRPALPCFGRDLEVAEWHRLVRADHVLAYDVVAQLDQPPPGWPDGWTAGTCRVLPKFNEQTTFVDFLVQEGGRTIATITDRRIDFYVRTRLPGAQPGETVGPLALRDCLPAMDALRSDGHLVCRDPSGHGYVVKAAKPEPVSADTIVARRAEVGDQSGGGRAE